MNLKAKGKAARRSDWPNFCWIIAKGGGDYDQSREPLVQQNEAVGHAVRAVYCYSAMADAAMEMNDVSYQGAVRSIWSDLVQKKYYVTGGVGSGGKRRGLWSGFFAA